MPELSQFLRDKGGWELRSTVARKGRGSSSLTTVLRGSHPLLYLKNLEGSGIKYFIPVSPIDFDGH